MAIFHLSTQVIGRAAGRSAVAAAAYRSGDLLLDERTGTPQRHGDADRVAHTEIIAPAGAPAWTADRRRLWNRVEAGERRKDSQLAREFEIALPNKLTLDQQRALVRGWVLAELTPHGVVADIAIHIDPMTNRPARRSDHPKAKKAKNDHVHVMTTMRGLAEDGEGFGKKLRNLNYGDTVLRWRASWAEHANAALERAGVEDRIDHRSHADRGIEEEPTKKEGLAARGMEARDQASDRMANNRAIRARNQKRRDALDAMKAKAKAARPSKERVAERRIATGAKGGRDRSVGVGLTSQAANIMGSRNARGTPERAEPGPGPLPISGPTQPIEMDDATRMGAFRKRNEFGR